MDLDDDLLALVGDEPAAPSPAAPSAAEASNKRKRAGSESGSDMDESDSSDEEGVGTQATGDDFVALFPYQNLFKDKAEKAQIMNLNEVERESILAERQDQVQKQQDRLLVRRMATQLEGSAAGASASASSQQEASLLRGKSERKKTTTGKSDSKSSKLDELKRKRESKKRREAGAYDSDDQDARPSNMYSDEDDHDQSEDERATSSKKLAARRGKKDMHEHFVDEIGLRPLFLPRGACMSNWSKPWFATVAKGAYVRVLVGPDPENPRENKYRLAVISDIVTPFTASELSERQQAVGQAASDVGSDMEASDSNSDEDAGHSKGKKRSGSGGKKVQQMQTDLAREKKRRAFQPYRFEGGEICDIMLDVRVGNAAKLVPLTEISNSMFTRREFQRFSGTLQHESRTLPLKNDAEAKGAEIKAALSANKSEADIDAALKKKKLLNDPQHLIFVKTQCREATSDERLRQRLDDDIRNLVTRLPASAKISSPIAPTALGTRPGLAQEVAAPKDAMAALSQRNKKANREEVRKAELAAQEARRRNNGKVDPSARVRTSVKVLHDVRASTPDPNKTVVFEAPTAATDESTAKMKAVMADAAKTKVGPTKLEESAKGIDVDLGDF